MYIIELYSRTCIARPLLQENKSGLECKGGLAKEVLKIRQQYCFYILLKLIYKIKHKCIYCKLVEQKYSLMLVCFLLL